MKSFTYTAREVDSTVGSTVVETTYLVVAAGKHIPIRIKWRRGEEIVEIRDLLICWWPHHPER